MRIIRPYGTSAVEPDAAERRRTLRRKPEPPATKSERGVDIEDFARGYDALVIGQWVSAIEKVAAKPSSRKRPSAKQRALRQKLGEAAWRHIEANGLLPGLPEDSSLETLWWMRIHPYPDGDGMDEQRIRGRWYRRFVGDVKPSEIDADEVVRRIARHLYEQQIPIHEGLPERKKGRISHRASSIAKNAPGLDRCTHQGPPRAAWNAARMEHGTEGKAADHVRKDVDEIWDRAWEEYAATGDVARRIREAAEAIESR